MAKGRARLGSAYLDLRVSDRQFRPGVQQAKRETFGLGRVLDDASRRSTALSGALGGLGGQLAGIGTAAGAAAAGVGLMAAAAEGARRAVVRFGEFERPLSRIVGLVGVARAEVQGWQRDMLGMAGLGRVPRELAEGMFFVTSAGLRGARALGTLEAATRASVAGLGDIETVADAATSAMNAYGDALSGVGATDVLVATVREGKLSADQLAGLIGRVLPLAAQMGVEFAEVGGVIASLTRLGLGVDESVTSLQAALSGLLKVTPAAEKALAKLGLTGAKVRDTIRRRGLFQALQLVDEAIKANARSADDVAVAWGEVLPNVRALRGALGLLGENAETTEAIMASLGDSAGATARAYEAAANTITGRWDRVRGSLSGVQVAIGGALAEAVVLPALESVDEWAQRLRDPIIGALGDLPAASALAGQHIQEALAEAFSPQTAVEVAAAWGAAFLGVIGGQLAGLAGVFEASFRTAAAVTLNVLDELLVQSGALFGGIADAIREAFVAGLDALPGVLGNAVRKLFGIVEGEASTGAGGVQAAMIEALRERQQGRIEAARAANEDARMPLGLTGMAVAGTAEALERLRATWGERMGALLERQLTEWEARFQAPEPPAAAGAGVVTAAGTEAHLRLAEDANRARAAAAQAEAAAARDRARADVSALLNAPSGAVIPSALGVGHRPGFRADPALEAIAEASEAHARVATAAAEAVGEALTASDDAITRGGGDGMTPQGAAEFGRRMADIAVDAGAAAVEARGRAMVAAERARIGQPFAPMLGGERTVTTPDMEALARAGEAFGLSAAETLERFGPGGPEGTIPMQERTFRQEIGPAARAVEAAVKAAIVPVRAGAEAFGTLIEETAVRSAAMYDAAADAVLEFAEELRRSEAREALEALRREILRIDTSAFAGTLASVVESAAKLSEGLRGLTDEVLVPAAAAAAAFMAKVAEANPVQLMAEAMRPLTDWAQSLVDVAQASGIPQGMGEVAAPMFDLLGGAAQALGEGTVATLNAAIDPILGPAQAAGAALGKIAGVDFDPLKIAFEGLQSVLAPLAREILVPLAGVLRVIGKTVGALLQPAFSVLGAVAKLLGEVFAWLYNNVFRHVGNLILSVWNAIAEAINWALGWLGVNLRKAQLLDAIDLSEEGERALGPGPGAAGAGGEAAQYQQARDITVNIDIRDNLIAGGGSFRDLAVAIRDELETLEGVGI